METEHLVDLFQLSSSSVYGEDVLGTLWVKKLYKYFIMLFKLCGSKNIMGSCT